MTSKIKTPKSVQNAGDRLDKLDSVVFSKVGSSFADLLIENDQGQQTIDINKLVYKPNQTKTAKESEKLRWYLPDYLFCSFNFLALTYTTYYFLNGLTILCWRNSMQSFEIGDCNEESSAKVCDTIKEQYGSEKKDWNPYTIIRFYGAKDVGVHGLFLLVCGIANLMNIILGYHACLLGQRSLLITHLTLDIFLFIAEVCLVTILKMTGRCDVRDREIIRAFLERYVENYGREVRDENDEPNTYLRTRIKTDMIEFDRLQVSLTCCGVGNWTDFLPRSKWTEDGELVEKSVIQRYNLDNTVMVIPSTCCRQWWVRNIYCAHEAHLWAYPTASDLETHQFRQRVSQWGCLPKLVGLCQNMVIMAGIGGIVAWIIHFFLSIVRHVSAILQIQTIDTLVLERKRIFRNKQKEFTNQVASSTMIGGEDGSIYPSISTLFKLSHESNMGESRPKLPNPPTEKDIAVMKSRKDFNRMWSAMKSTHLEQWIATGRAFVEESGTNSAYIKTSKARGKKASASSSEGTIEKLLKLRIHKHDKIKRSHVSSSKHHSHKAMQ